MHSIWVGPSTPVTSHQSSVLLLIAISWWLYLRKYLKYWITSIFEVIYIMLESVVATTNTTDSDMDVRGLSQRNVYRNTSKDNLIACWEIYVVTDRVLGNRCSYVVFIVKMLIFHYLMYVSLSLLEAVFTRWRDVCTWHSTGYSPTWCAYYKPSYIWSMQFVLYILARI